MPPTPRIHEPSWINAIRWKCPRHIPTARELPASVEACACGARRPEEAFSLSPEEGGPLICPGPRCKRRAGTGTEAEAPYCSRACQGWATRLLMRDCVGAEADLQREVRFKVEECERRRRSP